MNQASPANRSSPFSSRRLYRGAAIVALVAILSFILIAADVVNEGAFTLIDVRISMWLHGRRTSGMITFMLFVSSLHQNLTVTVAMFVIAAYLWTRRLRYSVLFLALAVGGGALVNVVLKLAFARARPHFEDSILTLKTFSFPSGHTMLATVFYGGLCVFAVTRMRDQRLKVLVVFFSLFMIALVGFSRMYLGVHYLSDVLGAMAEGTAWIAICLMIVVRVRESRVRHKARRIHSGN